MFKTGDELTLPVLTLFSDERLQLQFDDLDPDIKRFRFTILHCSADWSTSADLFVSDYIDGFREENIDRYTYSYTTTVRYTHFYTTFPTDNMRPKISGNYLLIVYDDDPSRVVFTRRFMVVEPSSLAISGNIVRSPVIANRETHQQIDFVVRLNGFSVIDVEREVMIRVMQNGRTDNILRVSKPRFARTGELDYRNDESITFPGGNQFRSFDIKSLRYQTERIATIEYDTAYHVYLLPDLPRTFKQYVYEQDLKGQYFVRNEEYAENSATEADYAWVHFLLPYPAHISGATFHVLGDLASWQTDESSRLYFNPKYQGYQLSLLLKQGYYNYKYVLKETGRNIADESLIEGNHWETRNDYTIFVYYRETGALYDRLLTVGTINNISP
jgi:hypothetical protein